MKFNTPLIKAISLLKTYQSIVGLRVYLIVIISLVTTLAESFGILMILPLLNVIENKGAEAKGFEIVVYNYLKYIGIQDSLIWILIMMIGAIII